MSQEELVTSCFPASTQLLRISIHKQRSAHLPHTRSAIQTRLFVLVNMQFKALTVLALSGLAIASPELKKRQSAASSSVTENPFVNPVTQEIHLHKLMVMLRIQSSVDSVLLTALPPSLLAIAVTNTAAVASIIESAFSAGQTPAWFSALPTDVQNYLLYSEVTPTATPVGNSISSVQASIGATLSPSLNTTTVSYVHSASLKATTTTAGGVAGSASGTSGAHASSTGGASYPSAVVGAGVAGALGLLGMLAL